MVALGFAQRRMAWCILLSVIGLGGCYKPYTSVGNGETIAAGDAAAPPAGTSAASATSAGSGSIVTAGATATSATPLASPTAGPASPAGTAVAAAVPTSSADKYFRPARMMPTAPPVEARASRSPVRPKGTPPPRSRVLAAPEANAGVRGITFDDLMFPMDRNDQFKPELLSDSVRGLLNQKVKIRGFIHPSALFEKGNSQFILVRDDQGCCFGPGALLYDCVRVQMVSGRTADWSTRPIAVEGVLRFVERKDLDGRHESIYQLDGEAVEQ